MVVDGNGQGLLGGILANDVVVQVVLELRRRGQRVTLGLGAQRVAGQFVADDVVAEVDALVADEHRRPSDQLLDLVLTLSAERAEEGFFLGSAFFIGHVGVP